MTVPAKTTPVPSPHRSSWPQRVMAIVALGFFLAGCVMLADWLQGRNRLGPPGTAAAAQRAGDPSAGAAAHLALADHDIDPRVFAYRNKRVRFGPVRRDRLGKNKAFFFAGPSPDGPDVVFGEIVARAARGMTNRLQTELLNAGPSAQRALRFQHSVGKMPGGAYLLRLPADVASAQRGRTRLEPGVVMLAYECGTFWEYVCFYLPQGLDVGALVDAYQPKPDALSDLGDVGRYLEPTLDLGGGDTRLRTMLCKARGTTGAAVDGTLRALERAGWTRIHRSDEAQESVYVLTRKQGELWIHTTDRAAERGVVTVMIARTS